MTARATRSVLLVETPVACASAIVMKVQPKQLGLSVLCLGLQPLQQPFASFAATVFRRCGQPVDAGVESGAERQHRHRHSHADPAGNGPLQDWLHRQQTDEQVAERYCVSNVYHAVYL